MTRWTDRVTSNGLMAHFTKVNGLAARNLVKANSTGQMAKSMKESSRIMNVMELEPCTIHVERNSKEYGKLERRMADAPTLGLMAHCTMSFTLTG